MRRDQFADRKTMEYEAVVNGHSGLMPSNLSTSLLRLARNEFCKCLRGVSEDDNTRCTVGLSARSARKPRATSPATSLHGSFAPDDLSLLHVRFPVWSGLHLLMLSVTGCDPGRVKTRSHLVVMPRGARIFPF